MSNVYICYDKKLRNFLRDKGFNDCVKGLHEKTLKPFWVFERYERVNNLTVNEALEEWRRDKA